MCKEWPTCRFDKLCEIKAKQIKVLRSVKYDPDKVRQIKKRQTKIITSKNIHKQISGDEALITPGGVPQSPLG